MLSTISGKTEETNRSSAMTPSADLIPSALRVSIYLLQAHLSRIINSVCYVIVWLLTPHKLQFDCREFHRIHLRSNTQSPIHISNDCALFPRTKGRHPGVKDSQNTRLWDWRTRQDPGGTRE